MNRLGLKCVLVLLPPALLAGCGPQEAVQLRYDRPAEYEIGPTIKTIGIAEFGGATAADKKWGDIASDRLAADLDECNRKYNRYQLVDRKRLKAILDEQDLQSAFSDSSQAIQAGKIANVDAMIYGTVNVIARDEPGTRTTFDPLSRSMKQVNYTKRYVMAAVNFTIDSVQTGRTLTTVATSREYDSEKAGSGNGAAALTKMMGVGGGSLPPSDQLMSNLIDQCVDEFVAKMSPHQVVVTERLGNGKSKVVKTANKLAMAGDYAEALEIYQVAIQAHPDDHQAMFNAGVVCEATGQFAESEGYYDRAFKTDPKEHYVMARKRVREGGSN
jgi:tetratricopeptide (TPR) repeat protein